MKVTVEVNDMKFLVPVGDGGQSLKWLAMVAAQRYVRVGVGHMRLSSANRFVRLMMLSAQSREGGKRHGHEGWILS